MKKLAFTGATGKKSGGAFANLIYENRSVIDEMYPDGIRAFVRENSDTSSLEEKLPDMELIRGDFSDDDKLEEFLKDVDTLVNIAGIYFSESLIEAAIKCGVRRVILVHTTGIYSKYKAAGELYRNIEERVYALCRENGIILSVCRTTMIYGNTLDKNVAVFIKMVDKFPVMPVVNGARYNLQPVHYRDLAKGYFGVLVNEEKTANKDYILSGGSVIELRDMLKIIGENLGKKVRFISCPFAIAYFGACVVYYLTFRKKDYREKVQRLCEPRAYSHEDAKNDFGYAPMSFREGIAEEVRQYLEEKRKV